MAALLTAVAALALSLVATSPAAGMSGPMVDDTGPVTAPPARRVSVVLPGLLIAVVIAIIAVLQFWPRATNRVVTYPDHVLASGGSGGQAWTVVVGGQQVNDYPFDGCAELRDVHGVTAAGGCGYRPDDPSTHLLNYYVGELPDGRGQVWFGPAPNEAATIEFRFPTEPPLRVSTVEVDGIPGRFFVLIHRAPRDLHDLDNYPDVEAVDGAGRPIVV